MAAKAKIAPTGSLRDRILKNSTIKESAVLADSKFFKPKDFIKTQVPMLNVALSGDVDSGIIPGGLMIGGPSRHFKTGFALVLGKAFLDKYEDGIILFYDSEFGSPQSYFESNGISTERVVHTPIQDVEQLKHDMMTQLKELTDTDHVMIILDSMGNLASAKEIEDALKGESKADFTRAKAFKSLFRMITPHLTIKGIPFIVINHSYKTIEMYSKDVVGGGTGGVYAMNDIWIIGRSQETEGDGANKELLGWNFNIRIEKSRFVKEKSKFSIQVSFEHGINRWSGLFEEAKEFGFIVPAEGKGRANHWVLDGQDPETADCFKRDDIETNAAFWTAMLVIPEFKEAIKNKYQLPKDQLMIQTEEITDPETGEVVTL